ASTRDRGADCASDAPKNILLSTNSQEMHVASTGFPQLDARLTQTYAWTLHESPAGDRQSDLLPVDWRISHRSDARGGGRAGTRETGARGDAVARVTQSGLDAGELWRACPSRRSRGVFDPDVGVGGQSPTASR